jgi:hypothetical protein
MAPPRIRVRGTGSIPPGYVLGRTSARAGDVQLLRLADMAIASNGFASTSPGTPAAPATLDPITPYIFIEGAPSASEVLWVALTDPGTFAANFSGSVGKAQVAATASTVVTIRKDTGGVLSTIGTATFAIAGTVPTLATTGGVAQSFVAGDLLGFLFPASPDATLAGIALSLRAQRT